jgi:zinc protease
VDSSFNVGESRGIYQAQYACDPPNVSKARAAIVNELKAMRTKPVTATELHQAKLMLLRDIPLGEASVDTIAQIWLIRAGIGLPLDERVQAGKIYAKLEAKDVQTAFAKWIRPTDLVQITQGPAPK